MKGYNGAVLRVDLSQGTTHIERPTADHYHKYIGGRGFIVYTLVKEIPPNTDPLGPHNRLIFAVGPLTGYLPGGGRNSVGAMSPLTNRYGESEAGGFWGSELKRAGFDAIIIQGKSRFPVYLHIQNGHVEIRDASSLWGLDIAETHLALQSELATKKFRVASIGTAGEIGVRYATIANDIRHVYGRTGMGAVMGSKLLKSVVVSGKKFPPVAHKDWLIDLSRYMGKNYKLSPFWLCGTGAAMERYEETGNLPVRNFSTRRFPGVKKIMAQTICDNGFLIDMHSCFACPMRCKKYVEAEKPYHVDPIYGGPEYETLAAFGSNCGIDELGAVLKAHELCNRFGIDTISTGASIAFAMECYEKGIITKVDTNGVDLKFGNAVAMLDMVEQIAHRQGFGDLLAQGTCAAALKLGNRAWELAMQVGGLELSMHDPRHNPGMALHYSMHVTGGDHCAGIFDDVDTTKLNRWNLKGAPPLEPIDAKEMSPDKAYFLYRAGFYRQACNQLGLCQFLPWTFAQVLDAVEAATGQRYSYKEFMDAVRRCITLARVFNLRQNETLIEDKLPERFLIPSEDAPQGRDPIDKAQLKSSQRAYYKKMYWDSNGVPTHNGLNKLGIGWAYDQLKSVLTTQSV